ncbi:hypothetical protein B0T19DRAFT_466726, partial [Cercophora scortea]
VKPSLLILDGFQDPEIIYTILSPPANAPFSVLITGNGDLKKLPTKNMELLPLNMDGSAQLFKRLIEQSGEPGCELIASEEERVPTAQILRRLGGFPVVIVKTAAHMGEANVSVVGYADILQRNDCDRSERGQKHHLVHHDSLQPIFGLSIRSLPEDQLKLLAILSVSRVPVTKASFQFPECYDNMLFVDANREQLESKWEPEFLRVTASTVVTVVIRADCEHQRAVQGSVGH